MQTRDWLIIGIPILFNGFIIFLTQKYFNSILERKLRNTLRTTDVIVGFKGVLSEGISLMANIAHASTNEELDRCLDDLATFFLKKFGVYVASNRTFLSLHDERIDEILDFYKSFKDMHEINDTQERALMYSEIAVRFSLLSNELEKQIQQL